MTQFEWSQNGLIPRLSERLQSDFTMDAPKTTTASANGLQLHVKDHSHQHIWKRLHSISNRSVMMKVSALLSEMSVWFEKTLITYKSTGEVVLRGDPIPGTDILKILFSIVNEPSHLEIGELAVLGLLRKAGKHIWQSIHPQKRKLYKLRKHDDNKWSSTLNEGRDLYKKAPPLKKKKVATAMPVKNNAENLKGPPVAVQTKPLKAVSTETKTPG